MTKKKEDKVSSFRMRLGVRKFNKLCKGALLKFTYKEKRQYREEYEYFKKCRAELRANGYLSDPETQKVTVALTGEVIYETKEK